jgi:hypothetical protein
MGAPQRRQSGALAGKPTIIDTPYSKALAREHAPA